VNQDGEGWLRSIDSGNKGGVGEAAFVFRFVRVSDVLYVWCTIMLLKKKLPNGMYSTVDGWAN
jgi:hypothetical protein